ncbi:tetratricopeptide repeat protein [Ancylobacter sonchi]|uniref:tetratricopeptide repeat protein n=1 Tax=Ancylobacter sonchi TaxID=1937790 RepID=UPI001BD2BDC5|nr:tetratricopeptide repeat protein [Ancylobacter sonchi]MBS7534937.1 tetratricopeptide repeat protein [Ancylobacter sonchi]
MSAPSPAIAERCQQARQAMAAGSLAAAKAQVESLLAEHPDDLRSHLVRNELLLALGEHAEALANGQKLLERWPRNPWLLANLVSVHMAGHDTAAAISLYREQVESSELPEADKTRIARRIAAANRRNREAGEILERRLAVAADDPALLREVASSCLAMGRLEEAAEFFARSHELSPLPGWAAALRLDAHLQCRRLAGAMPVADATGIAILADALRRFPGDPLFVRSFNRMAIPLGPWREIYRLIRMNETSGRSSNGLMEFELAKACFQAGDPAAARRLLDGLEAQSRWGTASRPLATLLGGIPDGFWQRARLQDDPAAEVQVVRTPGASMTLVVFATLTGNFMMLPLAGLDAVLAELPANVIYLRDTMFGSGLSGLRSLGPGIGATLDHLRRLIDELGAAETVTVGASVSGLSAMRYGARLGASRAVTFGGFTTVDPEFEGTPVGLQRTMRRAQQQRVNVADRFEDAATELARAPDMRVDMHVGGQFETDLQQADRLSEISQLHVHRETGVDHHYVALTMISRGRFCAAVAGQMRDQERLP